MNKLVFILVHIRISLNTIGCNFCVDPAASYISKAALMTDSFQSLDSVYKPHIGSCGEYCFYEQFGDVAHLMSSTHMCYCFNISTEIVYSYKYEENMLSIVDIIFRSQDLSK